MPRTIKYVDTDDAKILNARDRAKSSYQRSKVKSLSKAAQDLISKNKQLGIKAIERKLRTNRQDFNRKLVRKFLKDEHNIIKQTSNMVDKHIVANYLGDWCFDIIINRDIKNHQGNRYKEYRNKQEYPEYFPVFMHTNSGYVFVYDDNRKDEKSQNDWRREFKQELERTFPGYPIVNVRSDAESGFTNKEKNSWS